MSSEGVIDILQPGEQRNLQFYSSYLKCEYNKLFDFKYKG